MENKNNNFLRKLFESILKIIIKLFEYINAFFMLIVLSVIIAASFKRHGIKPKK
jgi:hypothetical protein